MCGIVAYIGHQEALPIIVKGLKRLEYRGYDSAGIALIDKKLRGYKKQGKVSDLESSIANQKITGKIGIGHTRWATHGAPNDINAHPHYSSDGKMSIIHNGIIENYSSLKEELENKGHIFSSQTDSEVIIHFIEDIKKHNNCSLEEAVRLALVKIVGAYAIAVISEEEPQKLVAARKSSPLILGIGKNEFFLASDATPIIEYTNEVIYLNDCEVAVIHGGKLKIKNLEDVQLDPYIQNIDIKLEAIEKGGHDHFMLKEICEQPKSIKDSMRGRINAIDRWVQLGGIRNYANKLYNADRLIIVACGTSWHAGLVAEYIMEDLSRISVEVEYASEFRYRNPIITEKDIVLAISQSGETADTLAAIELAKSKGATVLGICNAVGSSIARSSHEGVYTHAGPEIGVASTKSFTAQVTVLTLIALMMAYKKGTITERKFGEMLTALENIPAKIQEVLNLNKLILEIAYKFKDSHNFLYLGRGFNFPVALEGALKLKEISYVHAEGYPAAEMKHGPIALIDENMPVVIIATRDKSYEKIVSNIQEVKARNGRTIAVVTKGDDVIPKIVDHCIEIPATESALVPLLSVVPLQLLSYHIAVLRNCNVDQPRNLAKSVTVE